MVSPHNQLQINLDSKKKKKQKKTKQNQVISLYHAIKQEQENKQETPKVKDGEGKKGSQNGDANEEERFFDSKEEIPDVEEEIQMENKEEKKKIDFGVDMGRILSRMERRMYYLKCQYLTKNSKFLLFRNYCLRTAKFYLFARNLCLFLALLCFYLISNP